LVVLDYFAADVVVMVVSCRQGGKAPCSLIMFSSSERSSIAPTLISVQRCSSGKSKVYLFSFSFAVEFYIIIRL
jgi:hypothetical protein